MSAPFRVVNLEAGRTVRLEFFGPIGYDFWALFGDNPEEYDKNTIERTRAELKEQLDEIESIEAAVIEVDIESPGGDLGHALNIYQALREKAEAGATVKTRVLGNSASAATVIFAAGDDRVIRRESMLLVHSAMYPYLEYTNQYDLRSLADGLKNWDAQIKEVYAAAGVGSEDIERLMKMNGGHGKFIKASEVRDIGLATDIEGGEPVFNFDHDFILNMNRPIMEDTKTPNLIDRIAAFAGLKNEEAVEAVEDTVEDTDPRIAELEERINALEASNAEGISLLNEARETIATMKGEVEEADNAWAEEVAAKDDTIAEKDARIAELEKAVEDMAVTGDAPKNDTKTVEVAADAPLWVRVNAARRMN